MMIIVTKVGKNSSYSYLLMADNGATILLRASSKEQTCNLSHSSIVEILCSGTL